MLDGREVLRAYAHEHMMRGAEIRERAAEICLDGLLSAAELIVECFKQGGKVLICGNGGSAADAQHMAAELVNRLSDERDRPGLPAFSLTTDTSFLTAYANDCGFEGVFERQVLTFGKPGDVLLGISTSGNSTNVVRAVSAAGEKQLNTIGLLGEGGTLTDLVDCAVVVPSRDTQYVQEVFLAIEHTICFLIEEAMFGPAKS